MKQFGYFVRDDAIKKQKCTGEYANLVKIIIGESLSDILITNDNFMC
ncbi:hypothetical protein VCR14J2_240092 [Vibrio coralliirubri]|nr:conserved hypothetical protein [Vibrio chagasii]CDU08678.1 hypothetical protein VCR14J2_240092 [Vibrio coralliirubri]